MHPLRRECGTTAPVGACAGSAPCNPSPRSTQQVAPRIRTSARAPATGRRCVPQRAPAPRRTARARRAAGSGRGLAPRREATAQPPLQHDDVAGIDGRIERAAEDRVLLPVGSPAVLHTDPRKGQVRGRQHQLATGPAIGRQPIEQPPDRLRLERFAAPNRRQRAYRQGRNCPDGPAITSRQFVAANDPGGTARERSASRGRRRPACRAPRRPPSRPGRARPRRPRRGIRPADSTRR